MVWSPSITGGHHPPRDPCHTRRTPCPLSPPEKPCRHLHGYRRAYPTNLIEICSTYQRALSTDGSHRGHGWQRWLAKPYEELGDLDLTDCIPQRRGMVWSASITDGHRSPRDPCYARSTPCPLSPPERLCCHHHC